MKQLRLLSASQLALHAKYESSLSNRTICDRIREWNTIKSSHQIQKKIHKNVNSNYSYNSVENISFRLKCVHNTYTRAQGYTNNAHTRDVKFEFECFDWNVRDVHRVMFRRDVHRRTEIDCIIIIAHCTAEHRL